MNTPIYDFVSKYAESDMVRFHMPGHKGAAFLGPEVRDITEIKGADELYDAEGIISESERNATELFGTGRTVFSTEGSSQCIRAMLHLVTMHRQAGERPVIVAARNAHKAFLYAAVLLDVEVIWLWPDETESLCSCQVSAEKLERTLEEIRTCHKEKTVAAVYITSPDYLGGQADIAAFAEVCHKYGTVLAVDNAHGAYQHFLATPCHPMDLGADICCDSAHKTLPVLTGGAYLHISKTAPKEFAENAKQAMELFGSTSPSYLILQSLDLCNRYLVNGFRERLEKMVARVSDTKQQLAAAGWHCEYGEPLRLTIKAPGDVSGQELAESLRMRGIECEYADADFVVLMVTAENSPEDLIRLVKAVGENKSSYAEKEYPVFGRAEYVMPIRDAYFSSGEVLGVEEAEGRICRRPIASCPPAIPVVVPGERLDSTIVELLKYYHLNKIEVVKE